MTEDLIGLTLDKAITLLNENNAGLVCSVVTNAENIEGDTWLVTNVQWKNQNEVVLTVSNFIM